MIEQFTYEQIKTIIKELKASGYEVTSKQMIMKEEAVKVFGGNPFVSQNISGSIFKIADFITENFEKKEHNKVARRYIPGEIEETYRTIISGILKVLKPYYGMLGLRDMDRLPVCDK